MSRGIWDILSLVAFIAVVVFGSVLSNSIFMGTKEQFWASVPTGCFIIFMIYCRLQVRSIVNMGKARDVVEG